MLLGTCHILIHHQSGKIDNHFYGGSFDYCSRVIHVYAIPCGSENINPSNTASGERCVLHCKSVIDTGESDGGAATTLSLYHIRLSMTMPDFYDVALPSYLSDLNTASVDDMLRARYSEKVCQESASNSKYGFCRIHRLLCALAFSFRLNINKSSADRFLFQSAIPHTTTSTTLFAFL